MYIVLSLTPVLTAMITALILFIINRRSNLPGQFNTSNLHSAQSVANNPSLIVNSILNRNNNNGYIMVSTSETNLLVDSDEINVV